MSEYLEVLQYIAVDHVVSCAEAVVKDSDEALLSYAISKISIAPGQLQSLQIQIAVNFIQVSCKFAMAEDTLKISTRQESSR